MKDLDFSTYFGISTSFKVGVWGVGAGGNSHGCSEKIGQMTKKIEQKIKFLIFVGNCSNCGF